MRFLPVVAISLSVAVASAVAQVGAPFSSQQNALGGQFATAGMGRPLGGITPSRAVEQHRGGGVQSNGRRSSPGFVAPYGYSWYVPGLSDFGSYPTPSS